MQKTTPTTTIVSEDTMQIVFPISLEFLPLETDAGLQFYIRAVVIDSNNDQHTILSRVFDTAAEARAYAAKSLLEGIKLPQEN